MLLNNFIFPVAYTENGSWDRSCQHSWFSEFEFLYHDVENEALFYKRVIGSYIIIGLSQLVLPEYSKSKMLT